MEPLVTKRLVFITGGTGYIGSRLVKELVRRDHQVCALARKGSEMRITPGCTTVLGNALDRRTYVDSVRGNDVFVHLVGVSHPGPSKAQQFLELDLVSAREAIAAAVEAGITHFVYLSVAQPAPVMRAFVQVRAECESLLRSSGLQATIVRPWYVLGPGHRWPYVLKPMYWLAKRFPSTRDSAQRLGLITIGQMVQTLAWAVENPVSDVRVISVPEILRIG